MKVVCVGDCGIDHYLPSGDQRFGGTEKNNVPRFYLGPLDGLGKYPVIHIDQRPHAARSNAKPALALLLKKLGLQFFD